MKRAAFLIPLLILLVGAASFGGGVTLSFFTVETENANLVVSWQVDREEDVREYELLRRTRSSNGQFVKVQAVPPHGADKPYRYEDDQVYKSASEAVDYRLTVVYNNGVREKLDERSVNYTPTAIRRTWGSIKAMFQ